MHSTNQKPKTSTKVCVIDQKTFEQQSNSSSYNNHTSAHSGVSHKIRNSKYKHKHQDGNLGSWFDFVNIKIKKDVLLQKKLKKKRRPVVAVCLNVPLVKRRGKQREICKKVRRTRLKKEILRCREKKHSRAVQLLPQDDLLMEEDVLPEQNELQVATAQLNELKLERSAPATTRTIAGKPLHSRRFRDYCDNCTTSKLFKLTDQLLRQLNHFQRRAYAINEIKARAHRRLVIGFHEVQSNLRINKVKLVIIAPDCEECGTDVGLNQVIENMKQQCVSQNVPYLFSLCRRELAYSLYKKASISCIGILDIDSVREIHAELMEALQEARLEYASLKSKTI